MVDKILRMRKSRIIKRVAIELAKKEGKKLIEWDKLSQKEKEECLKNPEKFFVIIDIKSKKR